MSFTIVDKCDRVIVSVNDKNKVVVARYPDLSSECKEWVIEWYEEMTDGDVDKLRRFLDYKEDVDEFCV